MCIGLSLVGCDKQVPPVLFLTYGDILLDQPCNLHGLVCLYPGYSLLHQVPALHVQVEHPVLGLHLAGGDDLCEGVVQDGLVGDQVQEVHPMLVECKNVLTSFYWITVTTHLKSVHEDCIKM